MIKFSLRCDRDHAFQSWFRDGQSFDDLALQGLLACPDCGSTAVGKALMAPSVVTSRKRSQVPASDAEQTSAPPAAPSQPAQPVAVLDERAQAFRSMLREMRDHLAKHSTDVGPAFAEEARRINAGQSEKASIHGTASRDDVEALLEDGIDVMPLPVFPDERN